MKIHWYSNVTTVDPETVYIPGETPFYQVVYGPFLKQRVLEWVRVASSIVQQGGRIIIFTFARGGEKFVSTVPSHSKRSEFMTVSGTLISAMPKNVRLLLVNEGYFSSSSLFPREIKKTLLSITHNTQSYAPITNKSFSLFILNRGEA